MLRAKKIVKQFNVSEIRAYPRAVPIKGPVHGVATTTAKKPVKKLDWAGILFMKLVKLAGNSILLFRFKNIIKNKNSKNKLNSIDCS